MNDTLINAAIAFAMLFVLIVPLWYAARASTKKKDQEQKERLVHLTSKNNLTVSETRHIGKMAFAFTDASEIMVLRNEKDAEEVHFLRKGPTSFVTLKEDYQDQELQNLRLSYMDDGLQKELLLYRRYRDSEADIEALRSIVERIKIFLN